MKLSSQTELDHRIQVGYVEDKISLFEVLMYWAHARRPIPDWLISELETGFSTAIEGKRSLEAIFGLERRTPTQPDKEARRIKYSSTVYYRVLELSEQGKAIDNGLFECLAEELKPSFLSEWPDKKPPGGRTLADWYRAELELREPSTKKARNRRKSKTD